ncbi:MAG: PAS domain-containing protein, partial [Terriglobales bacterium]
TVNEELRHSNTEQHRLGSDLENLIEAVDIAFIMIDRELRVRRYSPAAERRLRLVPGDIGRRINEIRWGIPLAGDLDQLALAVLAKSQPQLSEIHDAGGHYYELRLHPHRGPDNSVDGAVIVLADTDVVRQLRNLAELNDKLLAALVALVPHPAALLAPGAGLTHANALFTARFGDGHGDTAWQRSALAQLKTRPQAVVDIQRNGDRLQLRARRIAGAGGEDAFVRVLLTAE